MVTYPRRGSITIAPVPPGDWMVWLPVSPGGTHPKKNIPGAQGDIYAYLKPKTYTGVEGVLQAVKVISRPFTVAGGVAVDEGGIKEEVVDKLPR